ncbi:MAG: XRE family transcriptional regulator [Alphaproteobacteria bacterium]|nr:XRE family transcriptional regulator [Alphaproteobacteria bacterium]
MTNWIKEMAAECKRSSQRKVAEKMGYSATVINMVLKGGYAGDLTAVKQAFNGVFKNATVQCPVAGEIRTDQCLKHQRASFSAHNPQSIAFYKACRAGCPHFLKNDGGSNAK